MPRAKSRGFTLIEIVVVAGIMALFSLTLVSVFLATVKGGSKSQLTQAVHQEGDFALKTMASSIRSSQLVNCNGAEITLTTALGSPIVYSLVDDGGVTRVASDSSRFLTGNLAQAAALNFTCYPGILGNQVVTLTLTLDATEFTQDFATSVSTRQY